MHLGEGARIVGDIFEHFDAAAEVEAGIGVTQSLHILATHIAVQACGRGTFAELGQANLDHMTTQESDQQTVRRQQLADAQPLQAEQLGADCPAR